MQRKRTKHRKIVKKNNIMKQTTPSKCEKDENLV
jgi:hypothetical protein